MYACMKMFFFMYGCMRVNMYLCTYVNTDVVCTFVLCEDVRRNEDFIGT